MSGSDHSIIIYRVHAPSVTISASHALADYITLYIGLRLRHFSHEVTSLPATLITVNWELLLPKCREFLDDTGHHRHFIKVVSDKEHRVLGLYSLPASYVMSFSD